MIDLKDPVVLAQELIRCPSVTPQDAGAQVLLREWLEALGFEVTQLRFEQEGTAPIDNLFARIGENGPHLAFAGHTDVVPPGPLDAWSVDPFAADIAGDEIIGRGAADMKTGITCFVAAVARILDQGKLRGSISLLITGDEEGPAINGTVKLIDWAAQHGHKPDDCIVGEPTCPDFLGQMIKIGRRGSLSCRFDVSGIQGHVAYPDRADNAAHRLVSLLECIQNHQLDSGNAHFPPSTLQITTIDIGNPASNVVPGKASASLNIRYNTEQTAEGLQAMLRTHAETIGGNIELSFTDSSHPFMTQSGPLSEAMQAAIKEVTGHDAILSTTGGTSDARFICHYCPVIEFGLVGQTMHAVDERVKVNDIRGLSSVYEHFLNQYFKMV